VIHTVDEETPKKAFEEINEENIRTPTGKILKRELRIIYKDQYKTAMNCLECENFSFELRNGKIVEICRIKGELSLPFLERLATCCNHSTCSSFDSIFFMELEKIAENCEHFRRRYQW